jgi:NADP-dependent 3-hydroxy acid dehydrogenase YdfG
MTSYFISGASSGLGAEMARQLSERGDGVALAARRIGLLEELAQDLASVPGAVTTHALDVTDPVAVDRVIRHADAVHGGLDVVVVNAGRGGGGRLGTGTLDQNRQVIETNLVGVLAQAESALSLFRSRGHGHLVLVSSVVARRGLPGGAAAYSATKAAVATLGASLRTEFAGSDIHITTLRPGYIETELTAKVPKRLKTPVRRGVASMVRAMDDRVGDAVVPAWPWKAVDRVLPLIPSRIIRRFM